MDLRLWASFSVICILLHCCQICESRPRPKNCVGLFKQNPNCPSSNIGFTTKRLFDEIMKRTDTALSGGTDDWQAEDWERELINEDDVQPELKDEQIFGARAPADGWQGLDDDAKTHIETRQQEVEELRTKELKLLLIRAMLDDLENETFDDM